MLQPTNERLIMTEQKSWQKLTRLQRKKYLQEQAQLQKEAWNSLTTMQKIQSLDARLGPNVGAKKQRARLKATLEKEYVEKEAKQKTKRQQKEKQKNTKSTNHQRRRRTKT